MELFNTVSANFFSIAMLLFILIRSFKNDTLCFLQDKLFSWLVIFTLFSLCFDILAWVANGVRGEAWQIINNIANIALFSIAPLTSIFWALYADFQLYHSEERISKCRMFFIGVFLFNAILAICSPVLHIYFYIDANNIFHRADVITYIIFLFFTLGILILSMTQIILHRWRLDKSYYFSLLISSLPVFVGSILQILFYGVSTIFAGASLSILFIFLSIQDIRLNTDPLTKAHNRNQLDLYIQNKIKRSKSNNTIIGGMMIDLDRLKQINDKYGHQEGDESLITTVKLIKKSLRSQDRIFRYGGDEFTVIVEILVESSLKIIANKIYKEFEQYNKMSSKPYSLNISIGYMNYDHNSPLEVNEFLNQLDSLMYKEKPHKLV